MGKLRCGKCKFKWKPKTSAIPKTCPYCGGENVIFDEEEPTFMDVDDMIGSR